MTGENIHPNFTFMADRALDKVEHPEDLVGKLRKANSVCRRDYMGHGAHTTENSINRARAVLTPCWGEAVVVMLASADKVALAVGESLMRPAGLATGIELSDYERMQGLKIHGYSRLGTEEDPAVVLSFLFDLQAINPKHYATARIA